MAVILEIARLWHELDFQPKRTVVFAALDANGGFQFVNHSPFPVSTSDTWTIVSLEGLGASQDELAQAGTGPGPGLARTFDQSARRFDLRTTPLNTWRFFLAGSGSADQVYSGIAITRPGDDRSGTSTDTIDHLDPTSFGHIGSAIAHHLMLLSTR